MTLSTSVLWLFVIVGHVSSKILLAPAVFPAGNLQARDGLEQEKSMDTQYAILDCFGMQVYNHLGSSLTDCLLNLVLDKLTHFKNAHLGGKLSLFNGLVELERRTLNDQLLWANVSAANLGESLSNMTRGYSVKVRVMDAVNVRVSRSLDAVDFGVEEDDQHGGGDEPQEEGRAGLSSLTSSGNKKKKKKKKNGVNKKYKKFLSMLPMFLIPFFIQATLLPLFLATLKMIALKSVFVGKLALLLVGYNALRNASIRRKQDDVDEHIAVDHYGYNGDMEYGAMLNGRRL